MTAWRRTDNGVPPPPCFATRRYALPGMTGRADYARPAFSYHDRTNPSGHSAFRGLPIPYQSHSIDPRAGSSSLLP